MPVIQSAKKKLRQDQKRNAVNTRIRSQYREAVKTAKGEKTAKTLTAAYSELDTAVKKNVIHKNKASRLKSQLAHAHGKN